MLFRSWVTILGIQFAIKHKTRSLGSPSKHLIFSTFQTISQFTSPNLLPKRTKSVANAPCRENVTISNII